MTNESEASGVRYYCTTCKREVTVKEGKKVPICCGKEMEPLPFCTSAPHAEMSRNYDKDEPCDPGTLPRKKK